MIRKLLNTSVFRLSLIYALLFSTVAAAALAFIYWQAKGQLEQQTDERLSIETTALLGFYQQFAIEGLNTIIAMRNIGQDSRQIYSLLIHRSQQDFTKRIAFDYLQQSPPQGVATISGSSVLKNASNEPNRLMLTLLPGGYQLLVMTALKEQHTLLNRLLQTILAAIATIFALALAGGTLMGYNVQHRIRAVSQTANAIIQGHLAQRMPVTARNDEFDSINRTLNTMLERNEQLMQSMRSVTDNLAHDLRNPLNRLRNRLETSQYQTAPPDYPQLIEDTIGDIDDIIRTFNALLSIAQIEASQQKQDWVDVDLSTLCEELADLYSVVAEEQQLTMTWHTEPHLITHGNRQLLAQAITNLLDNAVKYTPAGGKIHLEAQRQQDNIHISVADSGAGIPPEQREQVFKRFTRLDNARSTPGNGLGLSLVKAVAELHGAEIRLDDNHPGLKASLIFSSVNSAT